MTNPDPSDPSPIRYPRARLSPAKDELMVVSVPHAQVVTCDIAPILQQFEFMIETRELAERWEGQLMLTFDGWEDDPREVAEIPAIRTYFAALTDSWPYWLHFSEKVGDTLPLVLRLLCRGHVEQVADGLVGWCFDDLEEIQHQLLRLFTGMNVLHDRLEVPESMNQRISEEVAQLIECMLE
jgi:hypothetical protein